MAVKSGRAVAAMALLLYAGAVPGTQTSAAAARPELAGTWKLNRELSEFPREVGFDLDWQDSGAGGAAQGRRGRSGGGSRGGGRSAGSVGSGGVPSVASRFESEEDANKVREMVEAVRNPSEQLTISQTDLAITIDDAVAGRRTYHPTGKEETLQLEAGPIGVASKWQGTVLVIHLKVEQDREVLYQLSRDVGSGRLLVQVQFAERGRGQIVKRVYDRAPDG